MWTVTHGAVSIDYPCIRIARREAHYRCSEQGGTAVVTHNGSLVTTFTAIENNGSSWTVKETPA